MNNQNNYDKLGQILRGAATAPSSAASDEAFVGNVMRRIQDLETPFQIPGILWVAPVLLAAALGIVAVIGIQNETKPETVGVEELLLADMPAETQGLFNRAPSFSNILWSPSAGGFLP
jgi:hypothetical protein